MVRDQIRIPLADYSNGTEVMLGKLTANRASFTLDRCTMLAPNVWANPNVYVEMEIFSTADGVTWESEGGWGAYGGIHERRDGTQATFSGVVDAPIRPGRDYKAVLRCARKPDTPGPRELSEVDARVAAKGKGASRADIGRVPTMDEWPTASVRTAGMVRSFDDVDVSIGRADV